MNPFVANRTTIEREIEATCTNVGRQSSEVRLIAVTKTVRASAVEPLLAAGFKDLAENRWQQAREKVVLESAQVATWHFIGRLQSNKVKYVVPYFDWIHSLNSYALAEEISRRAEKVGKTMNCLVQVNASGETSKAGIDPEEVEPLLQELRGLPGLAVRGLMTMAPHFDDSELTRPIFKALRNCLQDVRVNLEWPELTELSMGMSNDFRIAVEEGATMIRVGRRLMEGWQEPFEE